MRRSDKPGTFAVLHRTLGTPGLVIAGSSALMFLMGLVIVRRESDHLNRARVAAISRLLGRWARTASADYLGSRNLVDAAEDWRRADPEARPTRRAELARRLDRLGDWFEQQNARSPVVEIVELWLRSPDPDGEPLDLHWQSRSGSEADTNVVADIPVLAAREQIPAVSLAVRYRPEPDVASLGAELETSYRRLLFAVVGLSGYSVLCLVYMGFHAHALHAGAAEEAARAATLDLADRTCHELGNVAFVLSNERRNLDDHLAAVERFIAEEPVALEAAIKRARLEPGAAERLRQALRREYADRGVDPAVELANGSTIARDVCRQIAVCSDYIALTVRELDGYLKRSALPVEPAPVDARECFDDAIALLGPSIDAAAVRIDRPDDLGTKGRPLALADRRLLVHALVNLLKNALEATRGGDRPPRIALATRLEGESIALEVSDNGRGIPAEVLPKILRVGYSTKGPGRGRGLAIVHDSIVSQGGSLRIESRPGEGSTFLVLLPRVEPPPLIEDFPRSIRSRPTSKPRPDPRLGLESRRMVGYH